MQIKAAVTLEQGRDFEWQEVELAEPALGEVRVRIVATGVCHTDAVARDLGIAPLPIVLGHEGAGVVEALGEGVSGLEVGDHVVLSFAHCGGCGHCLTGHPTVCDTFNELNFGGAMDDGSHRLARGDESLATFFGQSSFATHAVSAPATRSRWTPRWTWRCWARWAAASRPGPAPCSTGSSPSSGRAWWSTAAGPWVSPPSWRQGSPAAGRSSRWTSTTAASSWPGSWAPPT